MAFPTLASLVVILIFFTWLLAGAGFFFDRYRIPVLTAVVTVVFLPKIMAPGVAYFLNHTLHAHEFAKWFDLEHYYFVRSLDAPIKTLPDPAQALALRAPDPSRPYIIVTASGGGIQAAEWTAQILAQLEYRFADDSVLQDRNYTFHGNILLASGVSGGSLGLMSYLLEYTANDPTRPAFPHISRSSFGGSDPLSNRITLPSECSSLEAVGWGLAYYDLLRLFSTIRIPVGADAAPDRSWALATAFNRNLHEEDCRTSLHNLPNLPSILDGEGMTLGYGAKMLSEGIIPAFTFNTTAAETGGRFLLGNYFVPAAQASIEAGVHTNFIPAESFLQAYGKNGQRQDGSPMKPIRYADLPLATAARLSATFPYVSSATRIPTAFTPSAYHFVDGGYFDNDGTASVIEFLKSALDDPTNRGRMLKLLLVEIRDDDGAEVTTDRDGLASQNGDGSAKLPQPWATLNQLVAPTEALWSAGHTSISRRNRRELCLLEGSYPTIELHHIVFTIKKGKDALSPLSWNLTTGQIRSISRWARSDNTEKAIRAAINSTKKTLGEERDVGVEVPGSCEAWTEDSSGKVPILSSPE